MLLDTYQTVYVWIGVNSNKFEKRGALKSAAKYIESVNDERDKSSVNIVEVEPGKEMPGFTINFQEWSAEYAKMWLEENQPKKKKEM